MNIRTAETLLSSVYKWGWGDDVLILDEAILRKPWDDRYTYRKIEGLCLPMCMYYPTGHKKEHLKPAVVCIHGGAGSGIKDNSEWNGDYMNTLARYFAIRGAVGIIFSYRNVSNPEQGKDAFENGPELLDLYDDCLGALNFIRNNADRFGIDTNKIAVLGDSAGGHLAACLGTIDILRKKEDLKPNVVVACNPITDLLDSKWFKYIPKTTHYKEFQEMSMIDRARLISPLHNITKDTSPTLVIHGTSDTVVSPEHSLSFYHKMNEVQNKCEIELIEHARHAFILPEYYPYKATVMKAIDIADNYLVKKGILN